MGYRTEESTSPLNLCFHLSPESIQDEIYRNLNLLSDLQGFVSSLQLFLFFNPHTVYYRVGTYRLFL